MNQGGTVNAAYLQEAWLRFGLVDLAFTNYLAAVLRTQGYVIDVGVLVPGACATHELDIVAEKAGRNVAVACIFVAEGQSQVVLAEALAAYARYLDLLDGADIQACPRFAEYWLVTNGVFSVDAVAYAGHKGLRLIGGDELLAWMNAKTYPVTMVPGLADLEVQALLRADLLLARHLTEQETEIIAQRTGLLVSRIAELSEGI